MRDQVDWESFSLLAGRRLRWRRLGPLIRHTKLVDVQMGEGLASLRTKRSILIGFRAGEDAYGIRSTDEGYWLVNERSEKSVFSVQGIHKLHVAETRVAPPNGTFVTLPVNGRSRRRAVLRGVAGDGSVLFYLRWRRGSLRSSVAGLEGAVPQGQLVNSELLGLIYLSSTALFSNYFAALPSRSTGV